MDIFNDINITSANTVHRMRPYEDFSILWLDEQTNRAEDILYFKNRINYCKTFIDLQSCTSLIYNLRKEKFFLIVSGDIPSFYIHILVQFPQVLRIYVLLSIVKDDEESNTNDMKVIFDNHKERLRGPFDDKENLFDQVLQDADLLFDNNNRTAPLSVFNVNVIENTLCHATNNRSLFIWSQLLVEILLHTNDPDEAKNDMLFTSRHHYDDNKSILKNIAGFDENYQSELALHWYTKDSFVFRLINKALRTQDIDVIYQFRFFIKDLHDQLTHFHLIYLQILEQEEKTDFTVYRGQMISTSELKLLQDNIGNVVATNSFFSTSRYSSVACRFAGDGSCRPFYESVLFEINIHTNIKTKPFAKVDNTGLMNDENEIIFSMGTIFSIDSVEPLTETIWLVSLSLIEQCDINLKEILDHYRWDIEKSSSKILTLGIFLTHIGEYARAIRYYELLSVQSNPDPSILVCTYHNMSMAYSEYGIYDQALKYLEKSTLAYLLHFPNDQYKYMENISLHSLDDNKRTHEFAFQQMEDLDTEHALEEHLSYVQHPTINCALLALLAYIYHKTGKQDDARRISNKSITVARALIEDTHPEWHTYCAYDHLCRDDYKAALEEYQHTLQKHINLLPSKHSLLATIYYNMGDLFFLNNQIEDALIHFYFSLNIRHFSLPAQHFLVVDTLNRIDSIQNSTFNADRVKADCLIQLLCSPQPMMLFRPLTLLVDCISPDSS